MQKQFNKARIPLFLLGCITVRTALVVAAYYAPPHILKLMGYLALIPGLSFLIIWALRLRKRGPETFGAPIWWNGMRPVHGILYLVFAYMAILGKPGAWVPLAVDVSLGFIAWLYMIVGVHS